MYSSDTNTKFFFRPEVLFGNLDELCCVTYSFCKEFLNTILQQMSAGELNATEVLVKLFQKVINKTAQRAVFLFSICNTLLSSYRMAYTPYLLAVLFCLKKECEG